jgi:hypothetical protein
MIKISVGSRRDTMIAIIILEIILALIVEVTIDRGLITITGNGIETTTTITEGLVDTTITTIGFSVDSTPLMEHNWIPCLRGQVLIFKVQMFRDLLHSWWPLPLLVALKLCLESSKRRRFLGCLCQLVLKKRLTRCIV